MKQAFLFFIAVYVFLLLTKCCYVRSYIVVSNSGEWMTLKLKLKSHERIFVNGAVIAAGDRGCELFFLNRARILQQNDIIMEEDISGALDGTGDYRADSYFYYLIQMFYIEPDDGTMLMATIPEAVDQLRIQHPDKSEEIDQILGQIADGNIFASLKACQKEFPGCLPRRTKKETE